MIPEKSLLAKMNKCKKNTKQLQNNHNIIQKAVRVYYFKIGIVKIGGGGSPDPDHAKYMNISPFGPLFWVFVLF